MKRVIALIGALATSAAASVGSNAHAAGFAFFEQDAAATGRAGAVMASPINASTGFYNPAGVADLSGWNVDFGGTYALRFGNYESNLGSVDGTLRGYFPPNFHAYYSKAGQWGAGLSITTPFGLGVDWPKNFPGLYLNDRIDLKMFNIQPTFAYRINPMFSIGFGFNLAISSAELLQAVPIGPYKAGSAFLGADGAIGYGGTVGLLFTPMKELRIAATYRSRQKFNFDGKVHFTFGSDVPGVIRAGLPSDQPGSLSLTTPDIIGAGVAWDIAPNLTVEFNWSHWLWSTYDAINITFGPKPTGGNAVPGNCAATTTGTTRQCNVKGWMDTSQFRLGVDWKPTQNLNLRAGYIFDLSPTPSTTLDPLLPDANRHDFSVGVGYQWTKSLRTDFSYMLVYFSERKAPAVYVPQETAPGTYTGTAHLFALNFGLTF